MTEPTASLVRLREPTPGALRLDKVRRVVESAPMAVSVIALAAGLLPFTWLVGLGLAGGYIASVVFLRRRVRRFLARMRHGYAQAERGSFDQALEACREMMREEPWPTSHLAALTMAYFLRRRGQVDEAIELAGLAAKQGDRFLRRAIGVELAVCYALKGASGAAVTWLPEIRRRHDVAAASYGVVWARTGKVRDVLSLRVRENRGLAPFVRHELRLLAVLRGFAISRDAPDYLSIRPFLLEAGPAFPGEFTYLGATWPKMKEFVDTYVEPPD